MPDVQTLKKQLRGVRSTQKLASAMRTTSMAKLSKLNGIYGQYSEYGAQCAKLLERYGSVYWDALRAPDAAAPAAVIVLASNKGLCGSFNADVLNFAAEQLPRLGACRLIPCGREAIRFFRKKRLPVEKTAVFRDIPTYEESCALFDEVVRRRMAGTVSRVLVIYPRYLGMMRQIPTIFEAFPENCPGADETELLIPDRDTAVERTAKIVFRGMFYRLVLESALGAQAATLMTTRAAFDAATERCAELEGQINRLRQSLITADIIETSGKRDV